MTSASRSAPLRSIISSEETELIKYQLELVGRPTVVKAGLQRLCGHLEAGLYLVDHGSFRNTIVGLIFTGQTMVRRWAYKALAHVGKKDDIHTLLDRMRSEIDPENLTWIISAIFSLAGDAAVLQICRDTGVEYSDAMALASLLYGKDALRKTGADLPQVNVNTANGLTLKWCSLLAGYEKAPPNLLHPRFENRALLGILNQHDANEVAEYSVWALWKSPEFSVEDLRIPQDEFLSRPQNIRRWTNRLISKNPNYFAENIELFDDLCDDGEIRAREGLALGLRDVHLPELESHVLRWFGRESDPNLRELLLENLALSTSGDTDLFDLVLDEYSKAEADGGLRRRLRAAVAGRGGKLFQAFKRVDVASYETRASAPLFGGEQPTIGAVTVNTINVTGNLTAQNVAGGDLFAAANRSVQMLHRQDADAARVLEQIIALVRDNQAFDKEQTEQLIAAVDAVAKEPTSTNKSKLLQALKNAAETVKVAGAAVKLGEFIASVTSWL